MHNVMFKKSLVCGIFVLFVGITTLPSISGGINESRDTEITNDVTYLPYQVTITSPKNGIYFNNQKILPFLMPLVLRGKITIEGEAEPVEEIDRVEVYINGGLFEIITGSGPTYEFSLDWDGESAFSKINVEVIAYGLDDTQVSDEITIWRIFR